MLRRKIAVPNGKGRVINSHVSAWVASNQPADLPLLSKAIFLMGGIHSIVTFCFGRYTIGSIVIFLFGRYTFSSTGIFLYLRYITYNSRMVFIFGRYTFNSRVRFQISNSTFAHCPHGPAFLPQCQKNSS